jgi:hypothetical protein
VNSKHGDSISPDLLQQHFSTEKTMKNGLVTLSLSNTGEGWGMREVHPESVDRGKAGPPLSFEIYRYLHFGVLAQCRMHAAFHPAETTGINTPVRDATSP